MSESAPEETNPNPNDSVEEIEQLAAEAEAIAGGDKNAEPAEEQAPVDPLGAALIEAAKWKDLAARNQAELDNYRKRMAREKSDAIKFANAGLLGELLPVIDNFQMGLDAAKADGEDSIIARGMEMVQKQLNDFLTSQGAQEVPAVGEAFDPNLHEALSEENSDEVPEGHVIYQMRRGFKLHDRLLRAANVVVSKGPETTES